MMLRSKSHNANVVGADCIHQPYLGPAYESPSLSFRRLVILKAITRLLKAETTEAHQSTELLRVTSESVIYPCEKYQLE